MNRYTSTVKLEITFDAKNLREANKYINDFLTKIQLKIPPSTIIYGDGPKEIKKLEF